MCIRDRVLLTAILPLMLLIWLVDGGDDFAAIDHGESYGSSIYKHYQGAVYAAVPSNGYYRVNEADPAGLEAFDTGRYDGRQAARDGRHVYCGNLVQMCIRDSHRALRESRCATADSNRRSCP